MDVESIAETFRLGDMPGHLFRRLDYRANQIYQRYTGQSDLTPRQFGVLITLYQNQRLKQNKLGELIHMDRSSLGELLQRMVDSGLVNRQIAKSDKRASEIWIAPAGRKALFSLIKAALIMQEALIAPLPPEYRPIFMKCLRILADADTSPIPAIEKVK